MLPILAFLVSAVVGMVTISGFTTYELHAPHQIWRITDLSNPLPLIFWFYWLWNAYHFGMQNFGLARLLKLPGSRWLHKVVLAGGTMVIMVGGSYFLDPILGFILGTILISFGHWLAELGLTWRVIGYNWPFIIGVLLLGAIGFTWSQPTAYGLMMISSGIFLMLYSCRLGIGFAHFLTDAWIWKLSDPEVRAIIAPRLGLSRI